MPKNKLFQRLICLLKNYFFYLLSHFIFQNAFQFHLENIQSKFFSAQNIKTQKKLQQPFQLHP